ncbi:MAG: hypothetical protein HY586_00525 [Candidatus Omnitrophica bacterium]|nr:hypothetical protein [Candidatus Omnitrophota bacterium]
MLPIFIGLAASNTILLFLTLGTGAQFASGQVPFGSHFAAGVFTALFTCGVHSIVFTYFIGTGKWIKEEVAKARLKADDWIPQTKKFKMQTSPIALYCIMAIVITAISGATVKSNAAAFWYWLHKSAAYFTLVLNLCAFYIEGKVIRENSRLLENALKARL